MKKITKREKFEMLLNVAEVKGNEMLVEFIEHEIELLARKNGSEKKPTAQQQANAQIQQAILNGMEVGKRYTITDLIKEIPECAELTNQRVSGFHWRCEYRIPYYPADFQRDYNLRYPPDNGR